MTGIISGLARAGAIVQGVGQSAQNLVSLLGGTPQPGGVNIGGIDLGGFEIPDMVPWGSDSQIVTHRLPGGGKIKQLMGAEYLPIVLKSMLLGPDAVIRAQLLEQLVWAQQLTTLTFGAFTYSVIVKRFSADYRSPFWQGQYEIECETMPDDPPADGAGDDPAVGSPTGASVSALSGALSDAAGAIGSVANTAAGIVATGQAALNSVASIVAPISNAIGVPVPFLSTAQDLLGTAFSGVSALGGLAAGTGAVAAVSASLGAATASVASGMQATGAALMATAANALGGDLLSVNDLAGAATAAGIQASSVGMGYAAAYAQGQLSGLPSVNPSALWAPASLGVAQNLLAADRPAEQAALYAYLNGP